MDQKMVTIPQAQLDEMNKCIEHLKSDYEELNEIVKLYRDSDAETKEHIKFLEGQIEAYQYMLCARR